MQVQNDWTGNSRSTHAVLGARNYAQHNREGNDYYATEPKAARLLMEVEQLSTILTLTEEETACICYHMGSFTDRYQWNDYTAAIAEYPNVLWTHHADMYAAHVLGT